MMKKLFFFRSSGSGSGNNSSVPDPSTDKQEYWEKIEDTDTRPRLRRSLSFSSSASQDRALGQRNLSGLSGQSGSPSCSSNFPSKQSNRHSSRCRTFTPERRSTEKCFEAVAIKNPHAVQKPGSTTTSASLNDSSESSSHCSSKVLDRYIDGEQQQERSIPKCSYYEGNHVGNGNSGVKFPRQVQYTAPASPTNSVKGKPRSHSFREAKGNHLHYSSEDWEGNGLEHESPRRLAKQVIERLTQSRVFPKTGSNELNSDVPITIEDIYGGPIKRGPSLNSNRVLRSSSILDGQDKTTNGYHHKEISSFQERNCFPSDNCGGLDSEIDEDVELLKKSKEAQKRFIVLSEELEQENFLQDSGFSVPALIQTIRNLTEEKVSLALEVSAILRDRIDERASAKEEIRQVRVELDSRTRRLEKEKNELQLALEKELDRRSSDWSVKLEKYQAEEHRLRERVRELAEQNVSLQKEVSFFSEREMETSSRITHSEVQLKDLNTRLDEAREENQNLKQCLSEIQEKYEAVQEDRVCIRRNYEEKEKERRDLHKSVTRLLRTCSDQDKTIDGLRKGFSEEIKKNPLENFDKQLGKLQREQMRLTGVELALRKEVESYRLEVDSLRHENINLLQRLKGSGKEGEISILKLDQELENRVCDLQNQGLTLLNENTQLCSKLLDHIKEKTSQVPETNQGTVFISSGFDEQFVVEADMKVQCFKRGTESLRRSLLTMSGLLHEKSNLVILESHSHNLVEESDRLNTKRVEDINSELKAEILLTNLLREKLYSKEQDVEQLQAELATAVRGTDILRCEAQNALDTLSCVTHKMKDLELLMIRKDDNINRLQDDLQQCTRELTILRETLPRVSQERDLIWEEVKQYSENNMLLNSEINALKKKIEALDEDVLLKEGQITILKDTLGKPFDLLGTPDFRLQ